MTARTLTVTEAAQVVLNADPLSDVRISLGWHTRNGRRLPVLRISSKSTVNYKDNAKPLGTLHGSADDSHPRLLLDLARELESEQARLWRE